MQTKNPRKTIYMVVIRSDNTLWWCFAPSIHTHKKRKEKRKKLKDRLQRKTSSAEEDIQVDTDRVTDVPPDRSDGQVNEVTARDPYPSCWKYSGYSIRAPEVGRQLCREVGIWHQGRQDKAGDPPQPPSG